ncbi:efflux transporter outer membrane subunit [Sphingomonas sp. UYP23]
MAAGFAALALAGCVGTRPAAPVASAVAAPAGWRTSFGPTAPIEADWWKGFGDPVLTALVKRALAHNPDIDVAASRVAEARALARLARAQQAPLVTVGAGAGEARTVVLGQGVDALAAAPQASASYDLDLFGRLSQASASARATLLATQDARDAVALAVASTAASGYIALLGLDERVVTTRSTLDARADALALARRRAKAGYTSQLELAQAEAEYRAAEQLVPAAELAVTRQENALSILVGDPPRAIDRGARLAALRTPAIPDGLPASLLRRRPDIASAEATLVATDRTLDSSRAALLPNISLTGSGGLALSTALANPITLFSAGASILSPLFDGGRLRAQVDASAARRDQAAFSYKRTALGAFREVEDGLATFDRLGEQQVAVSQQVTALQTSLRISTNRYREGYAPYLDQLDAQRGLLTAQLVAIQIETDRLNAVVTLYQAMGGGWEQGGIAQQSPPSSTRTSP